MRENKMSVYTKRGERLNKSDLKKLYIKKGFRKRDICENLNCTLHILNNSIEFHNIENLKERYVRYLYNIGLRQCEISKKINRNQAAISRMLKKMGLECTSNRWDRSKETMLKKYGVDNIQKSPHFRSKTVETCINRYNVDTPLRVYNSHLTGYFEENAHEIITNSTKSRYGIKEYVFESGKKIYIQGYEPFALDILLEKYNECDIFTGSNVPIIHYNADNKNRKHYPDIYVKPVNKIIEVKSDYTIKTTKYIWEKYEAAKKQGYAYEIWVINRNGELNDIF